MHIQGRANRAYRGQMVEFVKQMKDQGQTYSRAAFERAFLMADTSYTHGYESGCQTIYVFLTDGDWSGEGQVHC